MIEFLIKHGLLFFINYQRIPEPFIKDSDSTVLPRKNLLQLKTRTTVVHIVNKIICDLVLLLPPT